MKQHIIIEQLHELSEKGRERLRKWWNWEKRDLFYCFIQKKTWAIGEFNWEKTKDIDHPCEKDLPLLSIGQMIEFLGEKKKDIHIERTDSVDVWTISTCYDYDKEWKFGEDKKELCDALFTAVKEILEND